MTDIEILEQSIQTLDNIMVPSIFTKSISIPIAQVSENLRALHDAIIKKAKENQNRSKSEETKKENQGMDFEIVDAGTSEKIPEEAKEENQDMDFEIVDTGTSENIPEGAELI